jgi:aminotransferase in exopolysaccharide biosynthesis
MENGKLRKIVDFIKKIYKKDFIALHEPVFVGNEKKYLNECIDSTFVSSVGKYVEKIEERIADYVGAKYAIAVVNGTSGIHAVLVALGVGRDDEVITQPLTFIATANAIIYTGAKPVFVDVDLETLGMSPKSLEGFLKNNCEIIDNKCINKTTKKIIKACVPMHTFGHPCKIDEIKTICEAWNIDLIEDSAESLGSFYKNGHIGTFGKVGVFSFNGNKIVTSGGGGVIVTDDEKLAKKLKHITTTAKAGFRVKDLGFREKLPNWEYFHDEIGFNYRMPNINAALLLAQLENLDMFLKNKRDLAKKYKEFFESIGIKFINEPKYSKSNFWLNAIMLDNKNQRDEFLEYTNNNKVMTRPIWTLMNKLPMYEDCQKGDLKNSEYLEERVVNIPSGVVI